MIRSISIFAFFALATVLVIVLQPGPRPAYVYNAPDEVQTAASRNQVKILNDPAPAPVLKAPDDVLSKLKAAARREPVAAPAAVAPEASNGRSVDRLQAALNASLGTAPAPVSDAPRVAAAPAPVPVQVPVAVNPDLRAMSWQTLNALNGLGSEAKAPGQEGSLLNSIVRRSMGQVGGQPAPLVPAAAAPRVQQQAALGTPMQEYVVESGDTLALIAIKLYGSALASKRILAENPALRANPNDLRIGQVLRYHAN